MAKQRRQEIPLCQIMFVGTHQAQKAFEEAYLDVSQICPMRMMKLTKEANPSRNYEGG